MVGGCLQCFGSRASLSPGLPQPRRRIPGHDVLSLHVEGAFHTRQGLVAAVELFEPAGQEQVIVTGRTGLRVITPARENLGEAFDATQLSIEIRPLATPVEGERADLCGGLIGAGGSFGFVRVPAGQLSGTKPDGAAAFRLGIAENLDLALVEVQRATPVLHRLEEGLE
jgi:hypothetical protein